MDDADPQIETVEDRVARQQDAEKAEPEYVQVHD